METATGAACAIVLVCWNNRTYLESCLRSIFRARLRHKIEVVVVDNGSTDGSQTMVRTGFPDVRLIQNQHNVGLGRASNQGIAQSAAPFVLLLNNDTIVNGASLEAMIDFMAATPEAGAVGGTLLNDDGTFQAGYNRFSTHFEEVLIATRLGTLLWPAFPSHRTSDGPVAVDWVNSACLLVRRRALSDTGLLDDSYFIYGDEVDLQYRLARAGWKAFYLPHATTVHFGGRSMDRWRRRRMVYRGKMLFYERNYGVVRTWLLRGMVGTLTLAKIGAWSAAWLVPGSRERAVRELASNVEVLQLALRLE